MNLFELCVKIGADVTDVNKGIDETGKKTSDLGEKKRAGLQLSERPRLSA